MAPEPGSAPLIVAGCDSRPAATDAAVLADELAESTGAELILATCERPHESAAGRHDEREIGELRHTGEGEVDQLRHGGEQELERMLHAAPVFDPALAALPAERRAGAERAVIERHPADRELAAFATARRADALVVGSSHRSALGRALIGSTGEQLLDHARCPVIFAPHGYRRRPGGIRTIAVAFDGGWEAARSVEAAAATAAASGAKLLAVGVAEPLRAGPELAPDPEPRFDPERLDRALEVMLDAHAAGIENERLLLVGDPVTELSALEVDLMFAGTAIRGHLMRILLGSVSGAIAGAAAWPVAVLTEDARIPFAGAAATARGATGGA